MKKAEKIPQSLRYFNIKHGKYKYSWLCILLYIKIQPLVYHLQNFAIKFKNIFFVFINILIFIKIIYTSYDILVACDIWLGRTMYSLNSSSLPSTECKLCSFQALGQNNTIPNSSERDIILTVAIGAVYNIIPFIRTLRTTNCKARVVIFIDSLTLSSMNTSMYEDISKCGIQFVDIGTKVPSEAEDIFFYRYIIFNNFLRENEQEIDRVILVDLFDTVFQNDPFITNFSENILYLSEEGYPLMDSLFNTIQIRKNIHNMNPQTFDDNSVYQSNYLKKIKNKHIINGGLQAGGLLPMLSFLSIMAKIGNESAMKAYGDDQAFLNIFAYSKLLKKVCDFEIVPSSSYFMSSNALYCMLEKNPFRNDSKFGNFSRGSKVPSILHQYNRCQDIIDELLAVCPNDYDIPYYIR